MGSVSPSRTRSPVVGPYIVYLTVHSKASDPFDCYSKVGYASLEACINVMKRMSNRFVPVIKKAAVVWARYSGGGGFVQSESLVSPFGRVCRAPRAERVELCGCFWIKGPHWVGIAAEHTIRANLQLTPVSRFARCHAGKEPRWYPSTADESRELLDAFKACVTGVTGVAR